MSVLVAVDGPAGSGKSSVARGVAASLGYDYLDTGAMYRALTYRALQMGIESSDEKSLSELAAAVRVEFSHNKLPDPPRVFIDGEDVTLAIRGQEVSASVSAVSRVPGVRSAMVALQRRMAKGKNIVVEGRDIGSVVFPEAQVKIYLTAHVRERARRRWRDLIELGEHVDQEALEAQLSQRDQIDSSRKAGPLRRAPDAFEIDTTEKSLAQVIDEVTSLVDRAVRCS